MPSAQDANRCKFTVFTPAYNRAHTLHRVYDSLCRQSYRDFEWLVIDDGSTDNTEALMREWSNKANFSVRYYRQENRGKHYAFNRAVEKATGEFLLVLDSDDACVPETLQKFLNYWEEIDASERKKYVGVTVLCVDQNGNMVGDLFPQERLDSDSIELRYRYKVSGEKWGFQRIDILRNFPFPEDMEKTYIPEDLVWNRIAEVYKTRFVNDPLRIYWIDGPSMVHQQYPGKNATGGQLQHADVLNTAIKWFRFSPEKFFLSAMHYGRFSFHLGTGLYKQYKGLTGVLAKTLWLIMLPAAYLLYLKDIRHNTELSRS